MDYSYEIDMWAFGCILYELIVRKPLFYPKTCNLNILNNKRLYEQHLSFIGRYLFELLEDYGDLDLNNKMSLVLKYLELVTKYILIVYSGIKKVFHKRSPLLYQYDYLIFII